MELIKKSITCKYCSNLLKKPVFLPCNNTLCSYHIDDELNKKGSKSQTSFICFYCKQLHKIPKEGFKENELARDIIQSGSHLTDEEKKLKTELEKSTHELNNLFKEYERKVPEIELFNYEYFSNLRNMIDLQRVQLKLKIDSIADKMIGNTKDYEEKYKQKLTDIQIDNQMINKEYLKKMKLYSDNEFRNPNLETNRIEYIKNEIDEKTNMLIDKLIEFEMIKINIKDCVFEPSDSNLQEKFFGRLKLTQNHQLVSCSQDESIKLWDLNTGVCLKTLNGHKDFVNCIRLLSTGELASCSLDKTIKIWSLKSGECIKTINDSGYIYCLKELAPNQLISGSMDGGIKIWDLFYGTFKKTINGHIDLVTCLETLPDGELISSSTDTTIKVWNLETCKCINIMNGHKNGVICLQILSKDQLASGSADHTIKIWNIESGKCLNTLIGHGHFVNCLQLLTNGCLVSGSADKTIRIWDFKKGKCLSTLVGHSECVNYLQLTSKNELVSCSHDKTIKMWDLETLECAKTLNGHNDVVVCLLYLSNDKIVTNKDQVFKIWEAKGVGKGVRNVNAVEKVLPYH